MTPLYALHKDSGGKVLTATSASYSYELNNWLRTLDIRAGDKVEFEACAERPAEDEAPLVEEAPAPLSAVK